MLKGLPQTKYNLYLDVNIVNTSISYEDLMFRSKPSLVLIHTNVFS